MDKKQFIKSYMEFLHPEAKNGGNFTEYVIAFVTFSYNPICCFSHIFAVFDKNGDGSIDFSEFVLACGIGTTNDLTSELELAFAM